MIDITVNGKTAYINPDNVSSYISYDDNNAVISLNSNDRYVISKGDAERIKQSSGSKSLNIVIVPQEQTNPDGTPVFSGEQGKIYLTHSTDAKSKNLYNEYIWVNDDWEKFGSAAIDISGKEDKSNKKDVITDSTSYYPSSHAVYSELVNCVKTVNGNGPDTQGNVNVIPNSSFLPSFSYNGTTNDFCKSIQNETKAYVGTGFTGGVNMNDLPSGLSNAECVVSVISTTLSGSGKIIHLDLYSTTTYPYYWQYNYYNDSMYSGWVYSDSYTKSEVSSYLNTKEDKGTSYTKSEVSSYLKSKVSCVNGNNPDNNGNVTVKAFTGITDWFTSSQYQGVATHTFCNTLYSKLYQKFGDNQSGLAFMLQGASFTDFPNSFKDDWSIATGELFIYVQAPGLYEIDMYTTNNFQKKGDEGQEDKLDAGKYTSIYDYGYNYDNHMRMLWHATLLCPQDPTPLADGRYVYVPTKDYHAISYYMLKNFSYNKTQITTYLNEKEDKGTSYTKFEVSSYLNDKADDNIVVKTVNNLLPLNGNVTINTFTELPSSVVRTNITTAQFCANVSALSSAKAGVAFLGGGCRLTDMPFSGNAEIVIYILTDSKVMVLELSSTDSFEGTSSEVSGKWMAMYHNGLVMSWQGFMTCPKDSNNHYVPVKDSDGISYFYIKKLIEANPGLVLPQI